MKKRISVPLLCALFCGAACMYAAYSLLSGFGAPSLFINFTRKSETSAIPLYFFNNGEEDLYLDAAGMEHFLFYPANGGNKYILQVRNRAYGASEAENTRRMLNARKLPPQGSLEIGDMRSLIARMPNENLAVIALYSSHFRRGEEQGWTGEVRSFPLVLREREK